MSRYNPFPYRRARSRASRLLTLYCLTALFIAASALHAAAQTRTARPVARLVSSSEQVLPVSVRRSVMTASAESAYTARPAVVIAGERPQPVSAGISSLERQAFNLINAERARNGQSPLIWDAELCRMAELHSQHMAQQNFFSHVGPDGMSMEKRAHAIGLAAWKILGENIAYNRGFADPATFAVQGWMHSEGHRANILNARFERSAIGAARTADGRIYLTQVFLAR